MLILYKKIIPPQTLYYIAFSYLIIHFQIIKNIFAINTTLNKEN